MTEKLMITKE